MATAVLTPQPVPTSGKTDAVVQEATPSILEEVREAQQFLRDRLAGALTKPPPGVPEDSLPTVPLIDLGPSFGGSLESRKAVATEIRAACLTTGFFQISNHGVTTQASSGILKTAEQFFYQLPQEKKDEIHIRHSQLFRGYEPADFSYVNPDDGLGIDDKTKPKSETKEAFNWGYEPDLDPTKGDGKYVELDGRAPEPGRANVWPAEKDLPGFYASVADYYGQILDLSRHLFRLFALSLGLNENYFDRLMTHPGGIARIILYPEKGATDDSKFPLEDNDGKLGLGAHSDYECFTLLLCSANPGLEILFPPSEVTGGKPIWRPCPVRPGTLTVNVADFLMRWTNDVYKSTIHRVASRPGTGDRYSVPFFFSINYDADVEPLPEDVVGKSKYKTMKAGEYILERLKATTKLEDEKKKKQAQLSS